MDKMQKNKKIGEHLLFLKKDNDKIACTKEKIIFS